MLWLYSFLHKIPIIWSGCNFVSPFHFIVRFKVGSAPGIRNQEALVLFLLNLYNELKSLKKIEIYYCMYVGILKKGGWPISKILKKSG